MDDMEILLDNNNIVLRKYSMFENKSDKLHKTLDPLSDIISSDVYITDTEKIVYGYDNINIKLTDKLRNLIINREGYISQTEENLFGDCSIKGYFYILPIIRNSDILGLFILKKNCKLNSEDFLFAKTVVKIIENT